MIYSEVVPWGKGEKVTKIMEIEIEIEILSLLTVKSIYCYRYNVPFE